VNNQKSSLAKGIQELDNSFSATLTEASESIPAEAFQNSVTSIRFAPDHFKKLSTLSAFLSDSLVQLGPLTNFVKIYQDVRSTYLVLALIRPKA
jgi:hypothetical protein